MPGLLSNDPGAVLYAIFDDRCRWNPQLVYLDSSLALVSNRMFEVEEVGTPANVIVVEMGESDDVVIFASIQIDLEEVRQGDPLVRSIVVTLYVGIIEKDLSPACEINPAAICVPEREKGQLVHSFYHFLPR